MSRGVGWEGEVGGEEIAVSWVIKEVMGKLGEAVGIGVGQFGEVGGSECIVIGSVVRGEGNS